MGYGAIVGGSAVAVLAWMGPAFATQDWGAQTCWSELRARVPLEPGFGGTQELPEITTEPANPPCEKGTAACVSGVGAEVRVHIDLLEFASGRFDPARVLCHELVHARFRQVMQPAAYMRLKEWQREGLAVYLSGELPMRINGFLWENWREPQGPLGSIVDDPAQHTFKHYVRDGLVFAYLDSRPGQLVPLLQRMASGGGLNVGPELPAESERYSLRQLRAVIDAWPAELKQGFDALQAKDYPLATSLFWAAAGQQEASPQTTLPQAMALFEYAKVLSREAANMERSTLIIRQLVERVSPEVVGTRVGQFRLYVAIGALKLERYEEAIAAYQLVLRYHAAQEDLRKSAVVGLAKAYHRSQKDCLAIAWIRGIEPGLVPPGSRSDEELRLMLGLSLYRTGRTEEGLALVRALAQSAQTASVKADAQGVLDQVAAGVLQPGAACT